MSMHGGPRQLALALPHAENFSRDDFLPGAPNAAALALIQTWPDWPDRALLLVGPEGSGKSHLAAIWADESGARFLSARALDASRLPAMLVTGALVLEDLAPGGFDEPSLFHLLNLVREQRAWLLLTARTPPTDWAIRLRDLASRLNALPVAAMTAPDDPLLRALLVKLFADRQLYVDEGLVTFVLHRIERSFAAARAVVARLDQEAMRRHRPLTRALAAEILRSDDT